MCGELDPPGLRECEETAATRVAAHLTEEAWRQFYAHAAAIASTHATYREQAGLLWKWTWPTWANGVHDVFLERQRSQEQTKSARARALRLVEKRHRKYRKSLATALYDR